MSLHRKTIPDPGTLTTKIVSETDRDKHILLHMLDLYREKVTPLDLTTMLYINTPSTEDKFPQDPTELSNTFLRRLWLYNPQSRNTYCKKVTGDYGLEMDENSQCAINPLDLVAAIYMTTNSFLRQEITYRMVHCNFAVPLYLPPVYPEKKGTVLLNPFREVLGQWKKFSDEIIMKNMANSRMPFLSAVRLGQCSVSKSRVLNHMLGGPHKISECFVNSDMDGGQLPRVLSDGLVEVCWNLPSGDNHDSAFPRPVLVANLRGDAANYEKQTSLLCYTSAVLVVFCESFGGTERELLTSWRDNTSHMILIDCSMSMEEDGQEDPDKKSKQRLVKDLELPDGMVLYGGDGYEERIADNLRDVLNHLIPHLHTANLVGTAGMANAVLRIKKSLLTMFHEKATNSQPTCLGSFMEHMCNLWESVKNENVAVKFGDTGTADAIIGLCTTLAQREKQLIDQMDRWVQGLDCHITDLKRSASQYGEALDSDAILRILKEQATTQINTEGDKIKTGLWDYIREKDINIGLVENYRGKFLNRAGLIQEQLKADTIAKLESAIIRHNFTVETQPLFRELESALEVRLSSLLQTRKNTNYAIQDGELEQEFVSAWENIPSNLKDSHQETPEIFVRTAEKLRENLSYRGLKKQRVHLWNADQINSFTVRNAHFALNSKMKKTLKYNKEVAQRFTNNLVEDCDKRVSDKIGHNEGYSDNYVRELLAIVDKGLEVIKMEPFTLKPKFEADIKRYICSRAAKSFQEMQDSVIKEKEMKGRFLKETKDRHMQSFIHQFREREQCQKAAQTFTNLCLKPTAEDFIYSSLERQIFSDMLQKENAQLYSSPKKFHYGLLRDMLVKDSFKDFHEYLQSFESFSQKTIEKFITTHLSGSVMIEDCREQRMQQVFEWMKECISQASSSSEVRSDVRELLEEICTSLKNVGKKITVPNEILKKHLFDITTDRDQFLTKLQKSVSELSSSIAQEFMENDDIIEVPDNLPNKLQGMLYEKVKGCDKRCPFCKALCDLGKTEHQVHEAVVHRPKGLVCYTNANSTTLSHYTCSADIAGNNQFQNRHTNCQSLPYKEYQSIYPDWIISPEGPGNDKPAIYWRYAFMRYNSRFAKEYQCAPARLPEAWGKITQGEALQSLKDAFEIKE